MMLCQMALLPKKKKSGAVPVYLNVYDLTTINGYAYWVGLGIYHSGVQVHGVEYGFGAHDHDTTGIFEVAPKQCPGFTFRKSVLVGRTDLGPKEVGALMEKLAAEYKGNSYQLITRNCNHFCDDVCLRLTGKPIPSWVNRLARLGLFCNCVLPSGLNETTVEVRSDDRIEGHKKKPRREPNRSVSYNYTRDTSSSSTHSSKSAHKIYSPSSSTYHSKSSNRSYRQRGVLSQSFIYDRSPSTVARSPPAVALEL